MLKYFADAVYPLNFIEGFNALGDGLVVAGLVFIGIFILLFLILTLLRKKIDKK